MDEKDGLRIDDDVGQRCAPLEYEGDESPLMHVPEATRGSAT